MQLLLRYRTAPAPKDDARAQPSIEDPHAKTLLTIEPSCKDEARVGKKGSLEYIWAPAGAPPPMVRDNRDDSAYLFGAICHARAVGAAIIMPTVNTEAMNEHLKEISTQVAPWRAC
jgi:hypothetical protein